MALKIIICVIVCAVVGLCVYSYVAPTISNNSSTVESSDKNKITVGITGQVNTPGNYTFSSDVTMEDLLNEAGGLTANADDRCFYYEAELNADQSYYIPSKYDTANVCSEEAIEKVNINEATADELMTISGFGSTISQAVVDYRTENGIFYTIEALMDVPGIGNAKFTAVKNYIILHE